jgi:hypothetical protein
MENMIKALVAQGIDPTMAASMVASFKPKKEKSTKKTSNGFFVSKKVDMDVTAKTYCQCCGSVSTQVVSMKATSKDSPKELKLACSVCSECPTFVRQFSYEELVAMILIGEKSAQELRFASVKFKGQLAKKLTPEGVIKFTTLSNLEKEVRNASNS